MIPSAIMDPYLTAPFIPSLYPFVLISCPLLHTPSVIFMLTVYGVFRRLITYSFDLGGKIIKWVASSRRAFNAFGHVVPPYWQHP